MDIGMFMKKALSTGVTLMTSAIVVGGFSGCAAPAKVTEETVSVDTPKVIEESSVLSDASFGEIKNDVVSHRSTERAKTNIGSKTTQTQKVVVSNQRQNVVVKRIPQTKTQYASAATQARLSARKEEWLNYQRKWEQNQAKRRTELSRTSQYNAAVRTPRNPTQVRQHYWRNTPAHMGSDTQVTAPRQQFIQIAMAPVIDAGRLSNAAVSRTRTNVMYDGRYIPIRYPNGDVPSNIGVCSDVVIRAYRQLGVDLQRLLHEDMTYNFNAYPNLSKWGLNAPDPNIDHRRVHNLKAFFARYGQRLPITNNPSDYQPGDVVSWSLGGDQEHIGVVVDRYSEADPGRPLIVHHIDARGVKMEDMLFTLPITGHYRYLGGAGTTQLVSM